MKRLTKMNKIIKALSVPAKFWKATPFVVEDSDLRTFLTAMAGFIQDDGEVVLEFDIESIVRSHSGDCRVWDKDGYVVFSATTVFMKCNYDDYYDDIYDWMKIYTPNLYKQHVEFDNKVVGNEHSDVDENWNENWKHILTHPNGNIDVEQLKKELFDFSKLINNVGEVYCHVTGGRLSYVTYPANTIIEVADEVSEENSQEALKEFVTEFIRDMSEDNFEEGTITRVKEFAKAYGIELDDEFVCKNCEDPRNCETFNSEGSKCL